MLAQNAPSHPGVAFQKIASWPDNTGNKGLAHHGHHAIQPCGRQPARGLLRVDAPRRIGVLARATPQRPPGRHEHRTNPSSARATLVTALLDFVGPPPPATNRTVAAEERERALRRQAGHAGWITRRTCSHPRGSHLGGPGVRRHSLAFSPPLWAMREAG